MMILVSNKDPSGVLGKIRTKLKVKVVKRIPQKNG